MGSRAVLVGVVALVGLAVACTPMQRLEQELRSRLPDSSATPTAPPAEGREESSREAIQLVVYRANFQQEQAIRSRDPSVMRDTATDEYYQEMRRVNNGLLDRGVISIRLVSLGWGPVEITGDTATATTYETWITALANGATLRSEDRNVYGLVQQSGNWRIRSNEHPDQPIPLPGGSREV